MCACNCNHQPQPNSEYARLAELLEEYKGQRGALIPVLQQAQDIFGYLPEPVRKNCRAFPVPLSQIYGVATFYAQFTSNPG